MHGVSAHALMEQILDMARWAPSGDNAQPWRFEIVDDRHVVVHGHDTREHCIYDLQGHASQLSLGGLLETMAIAASIHALKTDIRRKKHVPEVTPTFDVLFTPSPDLRPDPLVQFIQTRSVQRRPMRMRSLNSQEKDRLQASVGRPFKVLWLEDLADRVRFARLLFHNAGLRMTLPEAYPTHCNAIEWHARFSDAKIPDKALGADPVTVMLMRWAMRKWRRVDLLNHVPGGTFIPRLELDFIPAIACAAHFLILADKPPAGIDAFVAAGRAMQRFWLTATQLGLCLQPQMTPLIFYEYSRDGLVFSKSPDMLAQAEGISRRLQDIAGAEASGLAVFMGRIGEAPPPRARSLRLPLERLVVPGQSENAN